MYLLYCVWLLLTALCFGCVSCHRHDEESCDCHEGTFNINGTCYGVNENMLNYTDANEQCQQIGGNLVKFEWNENVTTFLESILSDLSDVWIGLDDRDEEGLFRWIADGTILNWNMSKFRSKNEDDLDCIGMDSSGDFQFLDCRTKHSVICDLKACPNNGTCDCYQLIAKKNPIDLYGGERCIISLQTRPPSSFVEQGELCAKIGLFTGSHWNGSVVILNPWYDIKNIAMKQIQSFPKGEFFWVGLNDMEVEGQIKFPRRDLDILNDTNIDFNAVNIDAVDCVSMNTITKQWNYAACSKTLPSICQTKAKCEVIASRDGHQTPTHIEVPETTSVSATQDIPESHVFMVSIVAGIILLLGVIVAICCILKYFKASLQRFRRYKMSTIHNTRYTEVETGNDIGPSNSFINRSRIHQPLPLVEDTSVIRDDNEHFYEDSQSTGDPEEGRVTDAPSHYNGGGSLTYEDVGSSTENHVELTDFRGQSSRASNQSGIRNNEIEIPFGSRLSQTVRLEDNTNHEDSGTFTVGQLTNLNSCYYEIDSNIYHEVPDMKNTADSSYDDVSVEENDVGTPEMTYNEFHDASGISDGAALDMIYNESYEKGNFAGNKDVDYDEI